MNININLGPINFGDSEVILENENPILNTKEIVLKDNLNHNIPLMSNFKIPNNIEEFDNHSFEAINPEEQKLIEEYSNLKEEYKKVKSVIQSHDDKDAHKIKKKIKKRLKEIKSIFKNEK